LPEKVSFIGDAAFFDCFKLSSMTFLGKAPSLGGSTVFLDTGRDVEGGLVVTVYKANEDGFANWPKQYHLTLNIVEASEKGAHI